MQDLWFRGSRPVGTLRALGAPRPGVGQSRPRWAVPMPPPWRARWQVRPRPEALPLVLEALSWLWAPPGLRHSIQQRPWQTEGTDSTAPPRGLPGEGRSGRMLAVVDNGWPRRRGWGWWGGCGVCLPFVSDQLHHRPHNLRRKRKESEQTGARPLPSPMPLGITIRFLHL